MVDASVVLKWFLPEANDAGVENFLRGFLGGNFALYAPDLLLIEAGSALWRRAIVGQQITESDARSIYRDLLTLPINFQPSERLAASTFSLSITHRHSVYDSTYCALSVEMDCEFVTADSTLVAKLGRALPLIRHVSTITL